jgi:hypothetical protein
MKIDLDSRQIQTLWLALGVWKEGIASGYTPTENELTLEETTELQNDLWFAQQEALDEEFVDPDQAVSQLPEDLPRP